MSLRSLGFSPCVETVINIQGCSCLFVSFVYVRKTIDSSWLSCFSLILFKQDALTQGGLQIRVQRIAPLLVLGEGRLLWRQTTNKTLESGNNLASICNKDYTSPSLKCNRISLNTISYCITQYYTYMCVYIHICIHRETCICIFVRET